MNVAAEGEDVSPPHAVDEESGFVLSELEQPDLDSPAS